MELRARPLKVLTFDIENRPLSYWYDGNCTSEITAIAWKFSDEKRITTVLLGQMQPADMIDAFVEVYDEADMVTGHYIRRHDLPIINAALFESRGTSLLPKLSCDTKMDALRTGGLSMSQESIAGYFGVEAPKIQMSQTDWREANRLTPEGLDLTRRRVEGDIIQHEGMRAAMAEAGWLGPPKEWRP